MKKILSTLAVCILLTNNVVFAAEGYVFTAADVQKAPVYSQNLQRTNLLYGEYLKYYKHEFDSYDDFLLRKYNFFIDEINRINKYLLFYKNLRLTEDGGLENMMYDEKFRETIIKFLGGICIED